MKAILFEDGCTADELRIGEVEKPLPSSNQILVKVNAFGVNRADIMQREGKYPPPKGASTVLGLEVAGVVDEIGGDVTKWKRGDKVFGLIPGGGYAEYAVIEEEMTMQIPHSLTMDEAAAIPEVFLTAYQALIYYGKIQKGETVLIHAGASGVGTAAIQIAKEMNTRIIVTASYEKHDTCIKLGAEKAIDYKHENFSDEVIKYMAGMGADIIIDFIGGPYLQGNINCLNLDGRLIMLSLLGGSHVSDLDIRSIVGKRLSIIGSALRSRRLDYRINLVKEFSTYALNKFSIGKLKPVIDKIYNWNDADEAHKRIEANKNIGKIVLRINK